MLSPNVLAHEREAHSQHHLCAEALELDWALHRDTRLVVSSPQTLPGSPVSMASARAALLLRRQCLGAAAANPYLFSGHGLRYRKLEVILTTVTAPPILSFRHTSFCKFVV